MIENLTEAIAHAREVAEMNRKEAEELREYGEHVSPPNQPYNIPVKACLECAAEHEQLAEWLTELQERREADRWISVKERMPESRIEVMVYCPELKTQYCAFYADKHWQVFGAYDTIWYEVTHWRSLPKAPESEDK